MNVRQLQKAYKQVGYISTLEVRRNDLMVEWTRLLTMRTHTKVLKAHETLPLSIAVGDAFQQLDAQRFRAVQVPMSQAVFDAILGRMDTEIMQAKVRLEEMGVEE